MDFTESWNKTIGDLEMFWYKVNVAFAEYWFTVFESLKVKNKISSYE